MQKDPACPVAPAVPPPEPQVKTFRSAGLELFSGLAEELKSRKEATPMAGSWDVLGVRNAASRRRELRDRTLLQRRQRPSATTG